MVKEKGKQVNHRLFKSGEINHRIISLFNELMKEGDPSDRGSNEVLVREQASYANHHDASFIDWIQFLRKP